MKPPFPMFTQFINCSGKILVLGESAVSAWWTLSGVIAPILISASAQHVEHGSGPLLSLDSQELELRRRVCPVVCRIGRSGSRAHTCPSQESALLLELESNTLLSVNFSSLEGRGGMSQHPCLSVSSLLCPS